LNQEILFAGLSHSLRVELARCIAWDIMTKVKLFDDCAEQLLTDICVLLREVSAFFGPYIRFFPVIGNSRLCALLSLHPLTDVAFIRNSFKTLPEALCT